MPFVSLTESDTFRIVPDMDDPYYLYARQITEEEAARIRDAEAAYRAYQGWLRELLTRPEFEYDYETESWRLVE